MTSLLKVFGATTAAAAIALGGSASASTYISASPVGGTGGDGPESASATIITGKNALTVALTSLAANPTSAGQEVSGIIITFGEAPVSATLTSSTGNLIKFSQVKNGKKSSIVAGPDNTDTINHWGTNLNGTVLTLATAGLGSVGGKPTDLIIDGGGVYTNANSSIFQHSPSIAGTGTFFLALVGDLRPTITGVRFAFGTSPDSYQSGSTPVCTECGGGTPGVPEPATWVMMMLGVGVIGALARRRRAGSERPTVALG